jgi:hypothetical protein
VEIRAVLGEVDTSEVVTEGGGCVFASEEICGRRVLYVDRCHVHERCRRELAAYAQRRGYRVEPRDRARRRCCGASAATRSTSSPFVSFSSALRAGASEGAPLAPPRHLVLALCSLAVTTPSTSTLEDIKRLLRHKTRQLVEALQDKRAPVNPRAIADRLVYDHNHLELVRVHREELVDGIAEFVRELRAAGENS